MDLKGLYPAILNSIRTYKNQPEEKEKKEGKLETIKEKESANKP